MRELKKIKCNDSTVNTLVNLMTRFINFNSYKLDKTTRFISFLINE